MSGLKRPRQTMPKLVREALQSAGLEPAFRARPPYQRNDYLWWINDAKRLETKQRRLKQMLSELKAGRGYMGQDWKPSRSRTA